MKVSRGRRLVLSNVVAALAATTISRIATPSTAPATHRIEIASFAFTPNTLAVAPGDTIIWVNNDIVPHTATADDGSWDTGSIGRGESGSVVVEQDMLLSYFCRFHPTMKAQLKITGRG